MPTSGMVRILGFDVVSQTKQVRERIAVVPQEMNPFQSLTAYYHVMLSSDFPDGGAEARPRANETLSSWGYLHTLTFPLTTSVEVLRQRTLVAMALATDAES